MISINAPAKINLYLHITGRRLDGYHLIDSLVAFADISDKIAVSSASNLSLKVSGPFADSLRSANNLVTKAAKLLALHNGFKQGAALHLTKNLPVASGIGGGSADAAATLLILCRHWDLSLPHNVLFQIAGQLGADVPVCLQGQASFVGGVGNEITLAPELPEGWLVLVNPGIPVPTPQVFDRHAGAFSKSSRFDHTPNKISELATLLRERTNDLTEAAMTVAPIIGDTIKALDDCRGALLTRLSGSGGTCFALFEHENDAKEAENALTKRKPNWWVRAAPLLTKWPSIAEHN